MRLTGQTGPADSSRRSLWIAVIGLAAALGLTWTWDAAVGAWVAGAAIVAAVLLTLLRRSSSDVRPSQRSARAASPVSLLTAAPDPIVLVNERAVVTEANAPALAALPGLRTGHPVSLALRAPDVLAAVAAAIDEGRDGEVEFGGLRLSERIYRARIRRFERDGGEPGGDLVAIFLHDLTAERRAETMRVDFIAHVSHELRTPLASLVGFIDTLQGPAKNDEAARARFLRIMSAQAGRMTRLIEDLLQLSRVELRAHLTPTDRVDLVATTAHIVELTAPLARERGVAVTTDFEETAEIIGDRDELLRLVENLLANAIKYGGQGGRVEVAVRRRPDEALVELSVRDHGPGIAPEHLPRLTERFYRVDVEKSRAQGGTGLGLAIVKHIVARHRGRLAIVSEPGQGATFTALFPIAPQ